MPMRLNMLMKNSKPIYLAFGLIGLYLYLEKGYTGRQVQKAHMVLASKRKDWPRFSLPKNKGEITIKDVLEAPAGVERDLMIRKWCQSTWEAYKGVHKDIAELVESMLS
jgi:hypothetical protein